LFEAVFRDDASMEEFKAHLLPDAGSQHWILSNQQI
jgi:hypothetical protein